MYIISHIYVYYMCNIYIISMSIVLFVFCIYSPEEICGHGDAKSSGCLDRKNRDQGPGWTGWSLRNVAKCNGLTRRDYIHIYIV